MPCVARQLAAEPAVILARRRQEFRIANAALGFALMTAFRDDADVLASLAGLGGDGGAAWRALLREVGGEGDTLSAVTNHIVELHSCGLGDDESYVVYAARLNATAMKLANHIKLKDMSAKDFIMKVLQPGVAMLKLGDDVRYAALIDTIRTTIDDIDMAVLRRHVVGHDAAVSARQVLSGAEHAFAVVTKRRGHPRARDDGAPDPCFDWSKGRCRFGDDCKYSHEGPGGTKSNSNDRRRPRRRDTSEKGRGAFGLDGRPVEQQTPVRAPAPPTRIGGSKRAPRTYKSAKHAAMARLSMEIAADDVRGNDDGLAQGWCTTVAGRTFFNTNDGLVEGDDHVIEGALLVISGVDESLYENTTADSNVDSMTVNDLISFRAKLSAVINDRARLLETAVGGAFTNSNLSTPPFVDTCTATTASQCSDVGDVTTLPTRALGDADEDILPAMVEMQLRLRRIAMIARQQLCRDGIHTPELTATTDVDLAVHAAVQAAAAAGPDRHDDYNHLYADLLHADETNTYAFSSLAAPGFKACDRHAEIVASVGHFFEVAACVEQDAVTMFDDTDNDGQTDTFEMLRGIESDCVCTKSTTKSACTTILKR